MEVTQQTKLKFTGVDFVQVNLNLINRVEGEPSLDSVITPKVFYPEEHPQQFTIIFDVKITAKDFFNIAVVAFGFFEFEETFADEQLRKNFVNTNAPAIMFPYVRSFITTLTSNLGSGIVPLVMPPHFFKGQLEEYKFTEVEDIKKEQL